MKCPVTMLRQLKALLSFSDNGSDVIVPPMPKGMDAWEAMLKINSQLADPSPRQPSTLRGDRKVNNKDMTLEMRIKECTHRSLRAMVGRIGGCIDWKGFSGETDDALKEMEAAKKSYRAAIKPMKDLYRAQTKTTGESQYGSIDSLLLAAKYELQDTPENKARTQGMEAAIGEAENNAKMPLQTMAYQLRHRADFHLIGSEEPLDNRFIDGDLNKSPLEMLYCCNYAAETVLDTTRIPACYSKYLIETLNTAFHTVSVLDKMIRFAPQLQHPAIFGAIEKSFAEMQSAVAGVGTFREINDDKNVPLVTAWIVDHLGLEDENTYNYARARKQSPPVMNVSSAARCPVTGSQGPR
jgi:hypothetical protein